MSKTSISILYFLLLVSCGNHSETIDATVEDSVTTMLPVAEFRDSVATSAVASYHKKTPNDLNDWYFSVALFETPKRFDYLVKMKYEEAGGEDTISFPNLGVEPRPELRQGKNDYSCIIGFLDNKGVFREYKEVSFANNQLKITTLKYYAVTVSKK